MSTDISRLRALFDQCADLPEGEALSWIERNVEDADMRIHLALMLQEDKHETGPMQRTLGERFDALYAVGEAESEDDVVPGTRFGGFEIVRPLGKGGQGSVYLARRTDDDFEQTVALKLLHHGARSKTMVERFRRERQILARFQHAGLARLIDGGVDNGIPYLVMEYVDGESIDLHCERLRLPLSRRLVLFGELCDAVAAAHRALIVHRDLKPSNVFVGADGRVKVLDFGIAKLLDEAEASTTQLRLLTPGYGSPEQFTGEPITLASDVYALGIILRQLVTDQRPPRQPREPWPQWPPSIPAELRWIFDKASALDAGERYRDAAELGEEIVRLRSQRPVHAHPPSRWYQARKFVIRHRGGVGIAGLLALTTAIGFSAALWQAHEARMQAGQAQAQAEVALHEANRANNVREFVTAIFDPLALGTATDKQPGYRELLALSVTKLDQDKLMGADERIDLMLLFARLNDTIGERAQALKLAHRAVAAADELLAETSPGRAQAHAVLGAIAYRADDRATATRELAYAEQRFQVLNIRGMPLIRLLSTLSRAAVEEGQAQRSLAYERRAQDERLRLFSPDDPRLGSGFNNLAYAHEATGDFEQAIAAYQATRRADLMRMQPDSFEAAIPLSNQGAAEMLAGHLRQGRQSLRQAKAFMMLSRIKPRDNDAINQEQLCVADISIAPFDAGPACDEAIAINVAMYGEASADVGRVLRLRAWQELEAGDLGKAQATLERASAMLDPEKYPAWRGRTDVLIGELAFLQGDSARAASLVRIGIERFADGYPPTLKRNALALLALACARSGDLACRQKAQSDALKSLDVSYQWSAVLLPAHIALAILELDADHMVVAKERLSRAIDQAVAEMEANAPRLVEARLWRVVAYARSADCATADAEMLSILPILAEARVLHHPLLAQVLQEMRATDRCELNTKLPARTISAR